MALRGDLMETQEKLRASEADKLQLDLDIAVGVGHGFSRGRAGWVGWP